KYFMHLPVPEQSATNTGPVPNRPGGPDATKAVSTGGWSRVGRGILLLLIGACAGLVADRFIVAPADAPIAALAAKQAPFTRIGDRIVVPAGSPLRERLAVAEPEIKEVSHTLVLPALVEPDPTRTVKVLPPVAGRITDLK